MANIVLRLYADGTFFVIKGKTCEKLKNALGTNLECIEKWSNCYSFGMNIKKHLQYIVVDRGVSHTEFNLI